MPKVSVVLPCYNVEGYIRECLDSALAQTLADIEIICVNDGSTDGTLAILQEYAQRDDRIRVIDKPNSGYGNTMNVGMDAATGEYIAILETDDYIKPNMYEVLYGLAEKNRLDFIKSDYEIFVGDGADRRFTYMKTCRNPAQYYKVIDPSRNLEIFNARMNTWTGLYRRSFLDTHHIRHNETPGASYQDNGFWFQTFLWARRIMFADRAFYQLRRDNPNSSVHNRGKVFCIFDEYDFIEKIVRSDPEMEATFIRMFQKKKFDNCMYHFTRVGDEFKMDFLRRMGDEFKAARANGELDQSLFIGSGYANLCDIMDRPEMFLEQSIQKQDKDLKELSPEQRIARLNQQLKAARQELSAVKNSRSYRIGRMITYVPRKARTAAKLLKDSGWRYTFAYAQEKLKDRFFPQKEQEDEDNPIRISVVMPVYNAHDFLRESLDCILNQTLREIEVICVDDESTDDSLAILQEYAQKDARMRVISQKNGGAGAARNNGLQHATGEYLSILDADDFYEPDMLEKAYHAAKANRADIAVFACDFYDNASGEYRPCSYSIHTSLLPVHQPFAGTDVPKDVFKLFVGWAWDKLFKTSFVRENHLQFQEQRTTNDMLFVFSAVVKAKRIITMQDVLAHHRREAGSLSVTREKSWDCFYHALVALRRQLQKWGLYKRFERDYLNYCVHFSLWQLNTLAEPTHTLLYNKLRDEWFRDLGVLDHPMEYFYNRHEYLEYRKVYEHPVGWEPTETDIREQEKQEKKSVYRRFRDSLKNVGMRQTLWIIWCKLTKRK